MADGLDPWARGAVRVKWPNDLLLNGRKLGGILCEASWDGHKLDHVVVGIGLNLVQGPDDFPDPIRDAAISLRIFANAPLSRYDVASSVVARLRDLAFTPWAAAESVVEDFAARDALYGRPIEVRDPEALQLLQSGVADGIDAGGALLLRRDDGANGAVRTGTVRLRER